MTQHRPMPDYVVHECGIYVTYMKLSAFIYVIICESLYDTLYAVYP